MTASPEYYEALLEESPIDSESVTYVIVTDATAVFVASALSIDLTRPQDPWSVDDENASAYALTELRGGVVALETTGYADPSSEALRLLSADGRRAAVVRSNIQAHTRFGCARDGELIFDDDEYTFIDDPARVPTELRPLFDRAWVDPEADEDDYPETDDLAVAMAMAEVITGLTITGEDLRRAVAAGFYRAPSLVYRG